MRRTERKKSVAQAARQKVEMNKQRVDGLSPSIFRKTGLLFACLVSAYLILFLAARFYKRDAADSASVSFPIIAALGACAILFTLSALRDSLNWLQPLVLLMMTPLPMRQHASSMFSLGAFVAAEILLYRLGFFEHRKLAKFLLSIAYFYLSEVLMGITSGISAVEIALPIIFMTIFLGFLMIVYGDKWVIYLKEPKPLLSLSKHNITKKEAEYLKALLSGNTIKGISIDDGVKESTVRNTLARVYKKFNVPDKSALMAKCENYSIIE